MGATESLSSQWLDKTERYLNSKYSTELLEKGDVFSHQASRQKWEIIHNTSYMKVDLCGMTATLLKKANKCCKKSENPNQKSQWSFMRYFLFFFPEIS